MQACDALDGVIDGLISNQDACNATFDPATAMLNSNPLRCPGGADTGDTCLSDAQIAALRAMNEPASSRSARARPPRIPRLQHLGRRSRHHLDVAAGADRHLPHLGSAPPANPMPATAPYVGQQVDGVLKYIITRDPTFESAVLRPRACRASGAVAGSS